MTTTSCEVVVAGGGPVGLVLSILLTHNGVDHVLLEARPHIPAHPKARGVSARSMEILRRIGLEDRVRTAGLPAEHVALYRGTSLVDPDFTRSAIATAGDRPRAVTPSPGIICAQNVLQAVLAKEARANDADRIGFGRALVGFDEDEDGVRSLVTDVSTGRTWEIASRYLIACDGAASTVRQRCGVEMAGRRGLGHFTSVLFHAPLAAFVADRTSASYFLAPPSRGGFMAIDNDSQWIYQYPFDVADEHPATFDDHRWVELIRVAAGIGDLEVTVLDTISWRMDACLAATYRSGRVLLAGDAAHVVPPTGGHGMNLGIGDADNLAWKLAAVVNGHAGDALLDSYEAERRPIAASVIDVATTNARSSSSYRIDDELLLGATYVSRAVAAGGTAAASYLQPTVSDPDAHPGRRLPHVWLPDSVGPLSTLDLVGTEFTLLHGQATEAHWRLDTDLAVRHGLPVTDHAVSTQRRWDAVAARCGLTDGSALLVRPDGHIAWCTETSPPAGTLSTVLDGLLAR